MGPIRVSHTQPRDPQPGTVVTDESGELIVYLGTVVTPEQIAELAPIIRKAKMTTIVAPTLEIGRQARYDIQHHGRPEPIRPVRVPKMQLPPRPPLPPRGRCGAPRTDGGICGSYAGTGTGRREGPCRAHGGQTLDPVQAEELTQAALTWYELTTRARTQELTPAEQLVTLTAAKALLIARRDRLLD